MSESVTVEVFAHQIAGHGTMVKSKEKPEVVWKPLIPSELHFYLFVEQELKDIYQFIPKYNGVVSIPQPVSNQTSEKIFCIGIEDLTYGMKKPCLLDLKIGTREYGRWCSEKKKKTQIEKIQSTASGTFGLRPCGVKVWKGDECIQKDKMWGRKLVTRLSLLNLFAQFVSLHPDYEEEEEENNKRHKSSCDSSKSCCSLEDCCWNLSASGKVILESYLKRLRDLRTVLSKYIPSHLRMYSSSLLFTYDSEDLQSTSNEGSTCKEDLRMIDFVQVALSSEAEKIHLNHPEQLIKLAGRMNGLDKKKEKEELQEDTDDGFIWGLDNLISLLEEVLVKS